MSVSFYDPENPTKYDDEYEPIGGGPEVNFANTNARMIIEVLGLETDPSLYGEVSANNLLEAINRATIAINSFCSDEDTKSYLQYALSKLKQLADSSMNHSGKIVWG
jgi:hypothetical protein